VIAMAPRRSKNQQRAVPEMHKRRNSYGKISTVLGILQSACSDIVSRFGEEESLRDGASLGTYTSNC
jgi:hypothetical protein